jgi:hypothetical protein
MRRACRRQRAGILTAGALIEWWLSPSCNVHGRAQLCPLHVDSSRPECADTVEKLEFWHGSQFRRPLAASTEISLGARLGDRVCYVRLSRRPCCDDDCRRRHYARGCGIFADPQFPSFSTISAKSGHPPAARRTGQATRSGRLPKQVAATAWGRAQ